MLDELSVDIILSAITPQGWKRTAGRSLETDDKEVRPRILSNPSDQAIPIISIDALTCTLHLAINKAAGDATNSTLEAD